MPTSPQAFDLAFALGLVGVYFDSATVLAAVKPGAEGELASRVEAQMASLKGHARQARQHIQAVHAAMAAADLQAPDAPETPDAYGAWVDGVAGAFYDTLDEAGVRAYLAGWWLGQWALGANLSALALYLRDAAEEHAYLDEVVHTYAGTITTAAEHLGQAREGAPGALDAALAQAQDALVATPTEGELLERAGALQAGLEQLDGLVAQVKAAL